MNIYLEKIAKRTAKENEDSDLKPHQDRSVDKLLKYKGLILHHSTGSGKTRTILEAVKRIQEKDKDKKQLIITPASLVSNISKEHEKHKLPIDMGRVETISYEKALNNLDRLKKEKYSLISLDEGHKLRNTNTKRFKGLEDLISRSEHRLVATATPIYNSPEDISPLINLVAGGKVLPTGKKDFENRYVRRVLDKPNIASQFLFNKRPEEHIGLKNKKELKEVLNTYVDRYDIHDDPEAAKHFPKVTEEVHEIPMDKNQERMYKYLEGNIPFIIRMKIRNNLPLDKKESAQLNAFSTGVRQVSNSIRPYNIGGKSYVSPKVDAAVKELEKHQKLDKNFKGVVYSNYLNAGLKDYSDHLNSKNIPHHVYHGGLSKKEKDAIIKDYNADKVRTLLISTSGAEGLDLKGTKLTQVLEPHFNESKISQVKGRGARYMSHAHLPEGERNMKVQHYLSTFHPGVLGGKNKNKTIDQYLKENSLGKNKVSDTIQELMKEPS